MKPKNANKKRAVKETTEEVPVSNAQQQQMNNVQVPVQKFQQAQQQVQQLQQVHQQIQQIQPVQQQFQQIQAPMQYPVQISMTQPGVSVPIQQVGVYGSRNMMNNNRQVPQQTNLN